VRFTRYEDREGSLSIGTESGFPERIWRELSELNVGANIQASKEFEMKTGKLKLNFGSAYVYKISDLSYVRKLLPSVGTNDARFGYSVSIYGDYIAVGSVQDNNYTGSVYIYKISDATFEEKIVPLGGNYDLFGFSVAIHGNYLLVGSTSRDEFGAIYLYDLDNLSNQYPIFASDKSVITDVNLDNFGSSISIYGDTIVVGAWGDDDNGLLNSGSIYIYLMDVA
jgi:hypothetical protein